MVGIYDNADGPLGAMNLSLAENATTTFQLRVDCKAGYVLSASGQGAGVVIKARFAGVGSFQDITATPLDLSAFDAERKTLDIEINTPDITVLTSGQFTVSVRPS